MTYYHASPTAGIKTLIPYSKENNGIFLYFSEKRENVLFYLGDAVKRYCLKTGYKHNGSFTKWTTYGFTADGKLIYEEYYKNAAQDTYRGVSGYIYKVQNPSGLQSCGIPFAARADVPIKVTGCEFIEDAYDEILKAANAGLIILKKYEDLSEQRLIAIRNTVKSEFDNPSAGAEYQHFLRGKFPFLR